MALREGRRSEGSGCCSGPDTEPPSHTRPSGSWNLEGLQALGPLATYISPSLWMQLQEVGQHPGAGGDPANLPPACPGLMVGRQPL